MRSTLTRRRFVGAVFAVLGLAAAGCRAAQRDQAGNAELVDAGAAGGVRATALPKLVQMTVYRDPSCGCCEAWAGIARKAGFPVNVIDTPDMPAIKRRYGVPDALLSCHTTLAGGYAIEGHVPLEDVERLLNEKPGGIRGIAVSGMPIGSPGMEAPDGKQQPFQVLAFDGGGRVSVFSA